METEKSKPAVVSSLSGKVLWLTISFVMLGALLIFLPLIANFRVQWFKTRIAQAEIAAEATLASPDHMVDAALREALLMGAGVEAVAVMQDGKRTLALASAHAMQAEETYDLEAAPPYTLVMPALKTLLLPKDRIVNVTDIPPAMTGTKIEISVHEWPLRQAMLEFCWRVFLLALLLSFIVATLSFAALNRVLVRPMQKLSANMMRFAAQPEELNSVIVPTSRRDELGMAERQLQSMQLQLQNAMRQRSHLAALGLAVSKVSHDLRNMLTSSQLISDRLGEVKDERVQRFTPKLIASLDRAINFLNQTIKFGKAQELPPRREMITLKPIVDDVFDTIRPMAKKIQLQNDMARNLVIDADREQLVRMLTNLVRNACQAIESRRQKKDQVSISARREGKTCLIQVIDTGPGIPPALTGKLFTAFQSAARAGGTGLGLAITQELAQAHGGTLRVVSSGSEGTVMEIAIPDRNGNGR